MKFGELIRAHTTSEVRVHFLEKAEFMSTNEQSGYEPFDELIVQLRAEGFEEPAARLHTLLHETAWTTGSELLGELGLVIVAFQRTQSAASADLKRHLNTCLNLVQRIWQKLGR